VSVQNKDLKTGKPYIVDVELGGEVQSPSGQVKASGTMLVSVQPWAAGSGSLSVYETKTKKSVIQKTLKARCSFLVKEKAPVDQCPYDPNKIVPGLCGCGVADMDSDQDATPDCQKPGGTSFPVETYSVKRSRKSVSEKVLVNSSVGFCPRV
jgi:hypothetical protein